MSETESLQVKVESGTVAQATDRLKELSKQGGTTEKATDLLAKKTQELSLRHKEAGGVVDELIGSFRELGQEYSSKNLASTITGLVGAYAGFEIAKSAIEGVIEATKEYEAIHARLVGVTGSVEEATELFEELAAVSERTTVTDDEMAESFIRLSQMGLKPTMDTMKAFANIAAGTGSSLENVSEIVSSASMGMFRGLRSVGVKATAEGDQLKLVFNGVATTINNDMESIQQYMVKLGNTRFAGEAERQLDTMGGRTKELAQAWEDLGETVGKSIVGDTIKTTMSIATESVKFATEAVDALLFTLSKKPKGMSEARMGAINDWISQAIGDVDQGADDMTKAERLLQRIHDMRSAEQKKFEQYNRDRKELLRLSMSPDVDFDVRGALADLDAWYGGEKKGNSTQDQVEKQKRIMEELARQQEETRKRIYEGAKADNEKIREKRLAEIEADSKAEMDLLESLKTPREKVWRDYLYGMGRIANGSGSEDVGPFAGEKSQAIDLLQARYEKELAAIESSEQDKRDALWADYMTEEEQLQASIDKKTRMIEQAAREDVEIAKRKEELLKKVTTDGEEKRQKASLQHQLDIMTATQSMFGSLTEASKNWGGEQSRVYAGMFAAQQAFGVAAGTVAMYQSIMEAQKLPWPANLAAGMQAAAKGASILAMMSSTKYTGAYDRGGGIGVGERGTVGEKGLEIVGPRNVIGREDTASILRGLSAPQRPIVNVRSIAAFSPSVVRDHIQSGDADAELVSFVERNRTAIRVALERR